MRLAASCIAGMLLLCAAAAADEISRLSLPVNDIVYDAARGRIYASVPGRAGALGNSIVAINPFTGTAAAPVAIGREPGRLALSDDGQYLYVALEDGAAVRRLHIPSGSAEPPFVLGSDRYLGTYYVEEMRVVPGNPDAVAISRQYSRGTSPRHAGVAIFDHGVPRPNATPGHTGSNLIEFSPSASRLYGYSTEGDAGFRRMVVDASGVAVIDSIFLRGLGGDIHLAGGLIYGSSGTVLDPERRVLVGTFPLLDGWLTRLAPDLSAGRVFFLQSDLPPPDRAPTFVLRAHDARTFLLIGSLSIPGPAGGPSRLLRFGTDGLAFTTTVGQLFLVRTSLVPSALPPRHRIAVLRPSTHEWILRADDGSGTAIQFGGPGDLPVPADYLGTGQAQIAVFRPATREWFLRTDAGGAVVVPWGGPGDVPVPADYLGLGRAQIAVFRPATGEWFLRRDDGSPIVVPFGRAGDIPVPADYFGERRAQIAVFRPATGEWLLRTDDGGAVVGAWGTPGDLPVPGDYAGGGRAQIAVFRPSTGEWLLRGDTGRGTRILFGAPGDVPLPADYFRLGRAQIVVYRSGTGSWLFYDEEGPPTAVFWGRPGDLPIPAAFAPGFGSPQR